MASLPGRPAGQSAAERFRHLRSPSPLAAFSASIRPLASSPRQLGRARKLGVGKVEARVGMQSNDAAQLHRFLSGLLMRL